MIFHRREEAELKLREKLACTRTFASLDSIHPIPNRSGERRYLNLQANDLQRFGHL